MRCWPARADGRRVYRVLGALIVGQLLSARPFPPSPRSAIQGRKIIIGRTRLAFVPLVVNNRLAKAGVRRRWRAAADGVGRFGRGAGSGLGRVVGGWRGLDMGSPFQRVYRPLERMEFLNPFLAYSMPEFRQGLQC
jgi:hypothetical protein